IYAVQGGLSAGEILGRTHGSLFWTLFYGGFVVAVSVHAAIGLRTIISEWTRLRGAMLNGLAMVVFAVLLVMGGRAVLAVTML
ncbi:MAG: succinate dehydrogenase, partial [Candidatus Puniceispirillaceae bacterium]